MLNIYLNYLMCYPLQIVPKPYYQQKEQYQTDLSLQGDVRGREGMKKDKISSVQCRHTDLIIRQVSAVFTCQKRKQSTTVDIYITCDTSVELPNQLTATEHIPKYQNGTTETYNIASFSIILKNTTSGQQFVLLSWYEHHGLHFYQSQYSFSSQANVVSIYIQDTLPCKLDQR